MRSRSDPPCTRPARARSGRPECRVSGHRSGHVRRSANRRHARTAAMRTAAMRTAAMRTAAMRTAAMREIEPPHASDAREPHHGLHRGHGICVDGRRLRVVDRVPPVGQTHAHERQPERPLDRRSACADADRQAVGTDPTRAQTMTSQRRLDAYDRLAGRGKPRAELRRSQVAAVVRRCRVADATGVGVQRHRVAGRERDREVHRSDRGHPGDHRRTRRKHRDGADTHRPAACQPCAGAGSKGGGGAERPRTGRPQIGCPQTRDAHGG